MHAAAHTPRPGLIRDLVALTKPRITLMVLITAGGGLWLGQHWLHQRGLTADVMTPLAIVAALLGTALVVSSANALNCWMEREPEPERRARWRCRS